MTIYIQQLMKEILDLCERFRALVYSEGDVDAALQMLDSRLELRNLPMATGATGLDEARRYLADQVVPHRPADLSFRPVSRTGDRWRAAEELTVSFVHDRELPWLLPGVPPTHRRVEVSTMSIMHVSRSLIISHRTLWDLHGLEEQVGVRLPVRSSTAG